MKRILPSLLSFVAFFWAIGLARAGDITVNNPWIREAPLTAKSLVAYMVINNSGKQPVQLLEVTSPDFDSVEIHQTSMHQGVMHMMALKSLPINPGDAVVLEPGSYHIMLIGPRKPVRSGDQLTLRLHFDQDDDLTVTVAVRKLEK